MKSFNFSSIVFLVSFLAALLSPQANAQESDQEVNGDVFIRTLGWGVSKSNLFYSTGGEYLPLTLSNRSLSGYHAYKGSSSFRIFRKVTDENTGAVSFLPYLDTSLVASANEQLLVFFQSPVNEDLIRIFAYEDSVELMDEKAVFVGNFSPLELAFQVNGEERFGLKPGQSRIIDYSGNPQAKVEIAAFRENEWQVEYRSTHRLRRGYRYYFLFRDMGGQSDLIKGLSPIVHQETIASVKNALNNPDGESATGRIEGSTVLFDPEAEL